MTDEALVSFRAVAAADRAPVYNTAAVSHRGGLPPATFRAWERRYGFPAPRRGPSNQRAYSEQDVQALIWLRARLAEGMTISSAIGLLREMLSRPAAAPVGPTARPPSRLATELEQALLTYDNVAADAVLAEAFALFPVEQVCLELLQPTLVEIGERWHAGQADAAQEHFASAFVRRRLIDLFQAAGAGADGPRAVAACAPGDWHELGLLMVAVFLARRGWRLIYLGGSLPVEGLLPSLARLRPDVLVLSATTAETAGGLTEVAELVAEAPPPRPLVTFGGAAFEHRPTLRSAVRGLYLGPTAATAVETLEAALAPDTRQIERPPRTA